MKVTPVFCLILCFVFSSHAIALTAVQESDQTELFELSLEELLNTKVITATRSPLKLADTPSAVTVITNDDIKHYGYQNLAEALARVPEIYTRYEGHNFGCDFRGFFTNNTRRQVLYLLNGHRINDRFHFGDFYPDIIGDLSTVNRIEVIRGPGAALYGNNAILGVVNIITSDTSDLDANETRAGASFSVGQIDSDSAVFKYQADLRHRFSDKISLALDTYWYDGECAYDTGTSSYNNPWTGSEASNDKAMIKTHTDFYLDVDDASFDKGDRIPNFNIRLNAGDFSLGSFNHTKQTSWIWPKDNVTFNHPDNTRSWGTAAVFLEWLPAKKAYAKYDILARISYNINTNREVADFSTSDTIGNQSLSNFRLTNIYSSSRWLKGADGAFYDYVATLDTALFSDNAVNANGGGSQFNYAGTDKSVGFEFQFTPYTSEVFKLQAGANYENARYENLQWYGYRNGEFIGWAPWGGITDKGWYFGGWLQATWNPMERLYLIGGARYDYQKVEAVYRQLGKDQLYQQMDDGYMPILREDSTAEDITPRLAINYYLNETDNIRLIYAEAFRAVPPQELIRLPMDSGEAESEDTKNYEIIGSFKLKKNLHLTANMFHTKSNITYQWNPAVAAFSKGSGWRNTGGSIEVNYINPSGFEGWVNATAYRLRRPTDALRFMTGEPNQYESLDSPDALFKAGALYRMHTKTTLAGELYYNSSTTLFLPADNNAEDSPSERVYQIFEVPGSFTFNLTIRQDLSIFGLDKFHCTFKIDNVLDADEWYGLNMDAQSSWDYNLYTRPSRLPGFGRRFFAHLEYRF